MIKHNMKISFDSNAWEEIFFTDEYTDCRIRSALKQNIVTGFICGASFRIEAISKRNRTEYFSQPRMLSAFDIVPTGEAGKFMMVGSIGPDDRAHPGLPPIQAEKLNRALSSGIKLMYGQNWLGLPVPKEISDPNLYVRENVEERQKRETQQLLVSSAIDARGVGNAAFLAADGWTNRPRTPIEEKRLSRACAEWADGELVAAHIAYQNDILCTNDCAKTAGHSIFDTSNRMWLKENYNMKIMTVKELIDTLYSISL